MEAWRDELYHHGILGMKWGVRRYQNSDGTLTEEGKKRYYGKVERLKNVQRSAAYGNRDSVRQEKDNMDKQGYKKWAKDNYLDGFKDSDQKLFFTDYYKELQEKIDYSQKYIDHLGVLNDRLDSIDPTSIGYKKAMKEVSRIETEWLNEEW